MEDKKINKMNQTEKRIFLIRELLSERPEYADIQIPADAGEQKRLLRSLLNVRMPEPVSKEFLQLQDEYLQEETLRKGITPLEALTPERGNLYLWQGDITTLRCDAIVNAANSQLLGCFCPCHGCIDNAIHTFAGVQLRLACADIMREQTVDEEPGKAKMTPAYNLPCNYVFHTVGPIVKGSVTEEDEKLLAACYRSCLELAALRGINSIAFCCISTGEFHFPNNRAAEIAIQTVTEFMAQKQREIKVIFNVFKDLDYKIYKKLLRTN